VNNIILKEKATDSFNHYLCTKNIIMQVRVRFAPSPTGPLHIGGLRTALFNFLFARKYKGVFILRIEDTDQTRFVPGAEKYIIESLKWCGLKYDEGPYVGGPYKPYRQSERKDKYREFADKLIDSGHAYIAFDTSEEIEKLRKDSEAKGKTFQYDHSVRMNLKNSLAIGKAESDRLLEKGTPHVIRFKIPENESIEAYDLIRERVSFPTDNLDDKVLIKADGLPTYHLANVVDDYLMKVTHVIRGEEWLPSLPLHILLYKALGWEKQMPQFAHLPLILKPGGQGKLSKRDGDKMGFPVFPLQWKDPFTGEISTGYRETGYLPEAVVNMLAFLGWNPGGEKEIYSIDELIEAFSIDRVGKSGARFDPEKAKWYNQQYIQKKNIDELTRFIKLHLITEELVYHTNNRNKDFGSLLNSDRTINTSFLKKIVSLEKDRINFIADFNEQSSFFFVPPEKYDQETIKKVWKSETPSLIKDIFSLLKNTEPFKQAEIEMNIKKYAEEHQVGLGKIMNPLRLLLVGGSFGPHLIDIMALLGKEEVLKRIQEGLKTIKI
jgi:glutamyl-tRNA synthetase